MRTKSFIQHLSIIVLLLALLFLASIVSSWTGPAGSAPNNNVDAPLNVGATDQIKDAGLGIDSLAVFGSTYIQGMLGVGRQTPVVALDVNGTLRLADGGETCQSVTEGSVRYNTTSDKIEFCNGQAWQALRSNVWENVSLSNTAAFETSCMYRFKPTNNNGTPGSGWIYATNTSSGDLFFDVSTAAFYMGKIKNGSKYYWWYAQEGNSSVDVGGPFSVSALEKFCD